MNKIWAVTESNILNSMGSYIVKIFWTVTELNILNSMGCYESKLNQIFNSNIEFYYSTVTYSHVYKRQHSSFVLYTKHRAFEKIIPSSDVMFWLRFCIVAVR